MTFVSILILFGVGGLGLAGNFYRSYIVEEYKPYPEPVAALLRRAIYYSKMNPNPQEAVRYYREALEMATKLNMDPMSDEVTGIHIELAGFMEALKQYKVAIRVLEELHKQVVQWIESEGDQPGNVTRRTSLLARMIGVALKQAELYAKQGEQQDKEGKRDSDDRSIERLNWALESYMKEQMRREKEGIKPDEDDKWITTEAGVALLERAGAIFHRRGQYDLAIPLWRAAIQMQAEPDCHTVTLLTHIATTLLTIKAQIDASEKAGVDPPTLTSPTEFLERGRDITHAALRLASQLPSRNIECDGSCALATMNLAEIALHDGNPTESRRLFNEAREMFVKVGKTDGRDLVDERLVELDAEFTPNPGKPQAGTMVNV
ncbi:MAG: hypothetical protein M1823_000647 [Watsoniomyces obsoletus]|nr:MAG: hypothetical protein M1823_000647 [Watsoniomyces obsoletus]